MSVLRPRPPDDPLAVESLGPADGPPAASDVAAAVLAALLKGGSGGDPLTAALLDVDTLLTEYGITRSHARRRESRLFAIRATARAIAAAADRVILLGDRATLAGPRLLLASCAHPWHDHLARGDRGGRPRLIFVAPHHDPDAIGGLLDLLLPPGQGSATGHDRDLLDRTALIVVGEPATAPTTDIVHVLGPAVEGRVFHTHSWATDAPGCGSGPGSVLGTAGLIAAALAGIDVVRLLVGAAALVARSRAPDGAAPVTTLATALGGAPPPVRRVVTWAAALDPLADWYGHLLTAAAHPAGLLHCGATGNAGSCLAVSGGEPRRDLPRGSATPEGWHAAAAADTASGIDHLRTAGATGAVVRLPRIDEHAIGQLLALVLLATVVERGDAGSPGRCGGGVPGL